MMGPQQVDQAALFYEFSLERHVRSPGPISPETYSGHIRRRALWPKQSRNGSSQRPSSSSHFDLMSTKVGPPTADHP
jgi:hypothetical protein